ncbi:MAG TPA: hemolysin family protein [Actinomycetota bacterium]|nr:hemolysin family protein [Actinomycetota bacterium]
MALLVLFGSVLAASEASLTRLTRARIITLREDGRRNAPLLEKIESDLPRYLNSVYFTVMLVQNGSAILVAILAEHTFAGEGQGWWVAAASAVFTLAYFVFVEAMSKTFGVLHSDRAALLVAPVVFALGKALALPTRMLIGLANLLLPGKGLKEGPFVEEEIRSMASAGHEEGLLEKSQAEMIHSVFDFGDRLVREVMVPRVDMVAASRNDGMQRAVDLMIKHGFSRIPVYGDGIDDIVGIAYAKDLLASLNAGRTGSQLTAALRKPLYVLETNRASGLLKRMRSQRIQIAVVTDEYGSTAGLVTLEDLLEELVGDISDEYDPVEAEVEKLAEGRFRISGRLPVERLSRLVGVELPQDSWDTVAGLVLSLHGAVPGPGATVRHDGVVLTVERMSGRRIADLLVTVDPAE